MTPVTLVGRRFLLAVRSNAFLSVITILSLLGVATGVCFLIMVLSVMAGFEKDLESKILGLDAHIHLLGPEGLTGAAELSQRIRKIDGVKGVMAYVEGEVLVTVGSESRGAVLRGVDPQGVNDVLALKGSFSGSCREMTVEQCLSARAGAPAVLIGAELATDLHLTWEPERRIKVISPLGHFGPFGFEPREGQFQWIDQFRSGFYEYDTHILLTTLAQAQTYFNSPGRVNGLAIVLRDAGETGQVRAAIEKELAGFVQPWRLEDWRQRNQKLFSALKLEKIVMFLVLLLIVLVSSFVILVTLTLLVFEKNHQISVLRALGQSSRDIRKIFLFDGAVIGLLGASIGTAAGLGICFLLDRYHFVELPSQYYVTTIPVVMDFKQVALVYAAAVGLALAASVYPARLAASTDPLEHLRYE